MNVTWVRTDGPVLACHRSGGAGPAVVLVHGNSCSARSWARLFAEPAGRNLDLAAIDLPGHGASADAAEPAAVYSVPGYARALLAAVRHLGLERAVFVGWSLGGHVVLEAAPELPAAAGFMAVASPPFGFPPDFGAAFHPHPAMASLFAEELTPAARAELAALIFGPAAPEQAPLLADLARTDGRARACLAASIVPGGFRDEIDVIRTLRRPLALVLGDRDPLVRRDYLERVDAPTLWRGALQLLPAGHAPAWQNPAGFGALLEAFVADCARPPA